LPESQLLYLRAGSATPMRGKSPTCRHPDFPFIWVFDPRWSQTSI